MTRTDIEIIAALVAIVLVWLCLFGVVTAAEDCLGVDEEPVPLFVRGGR